MAVTNTLPIPQTLQNPVVTFANADSFSASNPGTAPTNTKVFATAGANGSLITSIIVSSTDTAAQQVSFWFSPDAGTTKYLMFVVNIPLGSGYGGAGGTGVVANIDILGSSIIVGLPNGPDGRPIIELTANARIYCAMQTQAVTSNKNVYVFGQQEDL